MLKKILLTLCSLILAFAVVELLVSFVVRFPHYVPGRKFQIHDKLDPYNVIIWRSPYYKYWSVEGGNNVIGYNNIGFPGNDIDKDLKKNIFVLGSSYIEALQVKGDDTATGVLQKLLDKESHDINVINLGESANDPYLMWHRANFFRDFFNPDYVIVVIDFSAVSYFNTRWTNGFSFEIPPGFPLELKKNKYRNIASLVIQHSALINMVVRSFPPKIGGGGVKLASLLFKTMVRLRNQVSRPGKNWTCVLLLFTRVIMTNLLFCLSLTMLK